MVNNVRDGEIIFQRQWAMPNRATFLIPPIAHLLDEEGVDKGSWVDPFAGANSPASLTNDLDPTMPTTQHLDARDFLRQLSSNAFYGAFFDPPYSISQAAECYKGFGKELLKDGPHNMRYWKDCKDELARIIRSGGKIICCGWTTQGLGKNRGFVLRRILLVPHGGSRNDTIITVEDKT